MKKTALLYFRKSTGEPPMRSFEGLKMPTPSQNFLKHLIILLVAFISMMGMNSGFSYGQTNPNEALWSENGYSLKKVVSNTTIASGVNFSYTIIFSAPAGVPTISIKDLVPTSLQVVSVTAAGPVCGVTPTTNISGNTVTYNLAALPGACAPSGSFTIVVKFPEGTTCNGTVARNRAEILVGDKWQVTPYVTTTATAVNPWKVSKAIVAGASVNPNGGSCGYIMAPGDTITYRLSVMKDNPYWGNVIGQQNMSTAVVKDILPAGAQFISSSNPCATHPGGTGGTITWNVNCPTQLLDAAIPWAYYWVDIKVKYPAGSFPVSTQILNQSTLTGVSCNQPATHTSNQTCIAVTAPNPSGSFGKYLSLTNRVPGCSGLYYIAFCNNGNVPLTAFNINDAIPSGISVNQVQIYGANATTTMNLNINSSPYASGINNSYGSGAITGPVTSLQFQMTGSLPVGGCIYMYVNFTINPNPTATVVTNCATFAPLANALTLPQSCASFTVEAGTPKPCLLKDICSPQTSNNPGDIIRFRLRVQNIGSANLTGAAIQDALHSNFTYVGNETYYKASTYNPPCSTGGTPPPGTTAWAGVTPSHSGNNLSWNLPTVPSDCQLFYSAYCGYYGTWGLPYYYIEFDAKVDSFALPGVTPNFYQVSGGNLLAPYTSNTVNVLVVASFGQEVTKLMSTDGGTTFASGGTAAPGSNARFRLNYKNTSNVPVSSVKLIDLLGRDAGAADWLIFNRTVARGSQFDVSYVGNHATSLLPAASPPVPALTWAPGINICLPPYVTPGTCNPTTWAGVPDRNIMADYGTIFSLGPNKNLLEDFDVGIPLTALNTQKVCNDFAAIASANFLLNGSPQSVALTPVAAPPVCLTVDTNITVANCCDSVRVQRAPGANGVIGCCANITVTCPVKSIKVIVTNGTLSSVSWNCTTPVPSGYAGQSSFTFAPGTCNLSMNTCVDATITGPVTITYEVEFANGEKCEKKIELNCTGLSSCCDGVKVEPVVGADGTAACCAKISTTCKVKAIDVTVTNGYLSSTTWNCATPVPSGYIGQSSYTFAPNGCVVDMVNCVNAKQSGVVVINYVIYFENGEKCEKRIELDCKVIPTSCCDGVKVEPVRNATGAQECCAKITSVCKVKSVDVSITNGTFASTSWNCGPLPSGYVGQSSFTFAPNGCLLDMVNCVNATQSGVVVINYVIYFENGEKCEKKIELDCKAIPASCCDSIKVEPVISADGTKECCAKVTSTCRVKSVDVTITNGTFSSTSWNCGTLPSGFIGQSSFTFAPNGCVIDMTNCVKATQSGIVTISYVFYFENGEKCEKKIELDCAVITETCCEKVKLTATDGDKCCTKLTTECIVKSVYVSITNGTIGNVAWNAGTLPSGYAGQNNFTFPVGDVALNMELCVNATTTGTVVVNYFITFSNGERCEKSIKLDCTATETSCCALVDFKLKAKWPFWKTQVGTFHVVNTDPSVPICYIEILPSPSGIFTTSGLLINGVASAQSWNPTRIPAIGNITPSAVNTVDFSLTSTSYKGKITVCVVKCNGTKCCFEFNWTNSVLTDVEVGVDKDPAKTGLAAVSISPVVNTPLSSAIKYVSFGFSDEKEVAENISEFYAISASANQGEEYPDKLASTIATFMGKNNAFFELSQAKRSDENLGFFNLVFRKKLPKLGCTLYDVEGNILFSGGIAVSDADTVSTSVTINPAGAQGKMFEFINLYPNPSSGSFQISYATGNSRDVEIKLYTANGQVIHSQRSPERVAGIHNVNVAVNGLSAGFYKVVLISDGEIRNKSLVIK